MREQKAAAPSSAVPRTTPGPVLVRAIQVDDGPRWLAWALVAAAALPRLVALFLNDNFYGDAVARTELAGAWAAAPHWISSFDDGAYQFGPLHIYWVGAALKLGLDRELAGRLVSFVFGTLTVLPLFALTRRLFDWRAATAAALAFACWGMHWQMSSTAASEALSLFLVMWTLALFAEGKSQNRLAPLVASAAVLNAACATRYDAWLLIPLLCLVLLLDGKERVPAVTRAIVFGLCCLPFPLVWMHASELARGDPFFVIRYIDNYHRAWFTEEVNQLGELHYRLRSLFFWPGTALITLSPIVATLGAVGMVAAFRSRQARWLVWLCIVPTTYFALRAAVLGNFVPLARFTANQVVLLLPFLWLGLAWLEARARRLARPIATVGVLSMLSWPIALGAFTFRREGKWENTLRPVSPITQQPRWVADTAALLRQRVRPGEVALFDTSPDFADIDVSFFSGMPRDRIVRRRWPRFHQRAKAREPHWLVLFEQGQMVAAGEVQIEGRGAVYRDHTFIELPVTADNKVRVFRRVN